MKLLLICNRVPYPLKDGGAIAMYNMASGLKQLLPDTTLFALNTEKHRVDMQEVSDPLIKEFKTVYVDNRIKVFKAFRNLFSSRSYHVERFMSDDVAKALATLLSKEKFDIIQLEGPMLAGYLPMFRQLSKARVILRAHNIEHRIWERMYLTAAPGLKKMYYKLLAKRLKKFEEKAVPQFDAIAAITPDDAGYFKEIAPGKPVICSPAGLLLQKFASFHESTDHFSLFHIGSLDWLPNQEAVKWFIENVWPLIRTKHPEVTFHVAGRHMPEWMRELNGPNLFMVGEVEDAAAFMRDKTIMVVPLLSGSGMRLKIVEGMAMGKTIVSTHIGAEGINYTDKEHILIADSPEDFANTVSECISNPDLCTRIGQNARNMVFETYDNNKVISKLVHFYQELIGK